MNETASRTANEAVTLDVRDDIREGREPCTRIMETAAGLKGDQQLRLIAPFEPVPLFGVMARRGFSHRAQRMESGDWEILFARLPGGEARASVPPVEVDARGLEPPQPLVVILEALERIRAGAELRAHTDRRPMHLYAQLEERGFTGKTEEQKDGSFVTIIHHA